MTALNVSGANAVEAWIAGANHIVASGSAYHLFTTIDAPCTFQADWLRSYSPRRLGPTYDVLADVIQTIFPFRLSARIHQRNDLYAAYLDRHNRAKRWTRNRGAWGTYFERMICFPPTGVNQLEVAIEKLSTWQRVTTAFVFHLSCASIDGPRRLGGPCWQFGELIWRDGNVLDLSVTYRNHDFFNKALGNFIGLGLLLEFICNSSGKVPGRLTCHSVHAYSSVSRAKLESLAAST
jgi:hypothetical protein